MATLTKRAIRVRTADGWQDIAIQGPQGVQGPPGLATAAAGGVLLGNYPNPGMAAGAAAANLGAPAGDLQGAWPAPTIKDGAVKSRHVLLDVQQLDWTNTVIGGVAVPASGSEIGRTGAVGTDWRLSYTPPVNAWWEFTYRLTQVNKGTAGWAYFIIDAELLTGAVPATAGTLVVTPPKLLTRGILSLYGVGGSEYGTVEAHKRIPLSAGVAYTLRPVISYSGSGWTFTAGEQHNPTAFAMAWAR